MRKILLLIAMFAASFPVLAQEKESVYERVIKTGTLRCGYGIFPPMVVKDPNTGTLSGIFVDIMKEIGMATGLKVEFTQEIDWGQIAEALKTNKIDAMCAGMVATPKRGTVMAFSDPLFFLKGEAFAREDDRRFDNSYDAINQPDVRLAVNEGDVTQDIARRQFPKAKLVFKTQMAGDDILFMDVASNKADVTFNAPSMVHAFNKKSSVKLRVIPLPRPITIAPNVIAVDIHEQALQDLLNTAVGELHYNGVIADIFEKYGPEAKGDFVLKTPGASQ